MSLGPVMLDVVGLILAINLGGDYLRDALDVRKPD